MTKNICMCQGVREFISFEDFVHSSIQGLENCIKKRKERLITGVNNSSDNINTEKKPTKSWKQKWEEK